MRLRWRIGLGILVFGLIVFCFVELGGLRHRFPGSVPSFVFIEGGVARLGSREGRVHEQPRRASVESFRMSRFEVTVKQFCRYMNNSSWEVRARPSDVEEVEGRWRPKRGASRYPVSGVTLEQSRLYCAWLGNFLEVEVSLPSEEQWEYAARAGLHGGRFPWGWGGIAGRVASGELECGVVGRYKANLWGLYDMAGSVFEWCEASFSGDDVARGGSYSEGEASAFTVFRRTQFPRGYADRDVGFRVVLRGLDGG